jgi:hypothetical protein
LIQENTRLALAQLIQENTQLAQFPRQRTQYPTAAQIQKQVACHNTTALTPNAARSTSETFKTFATIFTNFSSPSTSTQQVHQHSKQELDRRDYPINRKVENCGEPT